MTLSGRLICTNRYLFGSILQVATLVNAVIVIANNQQNTDQIKILELIRVVAALLFIIAAYFCSKGGTLIIFFNAIFSCLTFCSLVAFGTVYDFRSKVIELHLQIISVYLGFGSLQTEILNNFEVENEKDYSGRSQKVKKPRKDKFNNTVWNSTETGRQKTKEANENDKTCVERWMKHIAQNQLVVSTVGTVFLAITLGVVIRAHSPAWSEREQMYLGFIGEIFLRMLKCLVLPLIFASLVYAFASLDISVSKVITFRIMTYYLATTLAAIFLGIGLVLAIRPGSNHHDKTQELEKIVVQPLTTWDSLMDLIRNIFPDNFFGSFISYQTTVLDCKNLPINNETSTNSTGSETSFVNGTENGNQRIEDCGISHQTREGSNIVGVVMFACLFGVFIAMLPDKKLMVDLFCLLNDLFMEMTTMVIQIMPFCVIFMIMPRIITVGDLSVMFGSVGLYSVTVISGLLIHCLIILPAIFFVFTRENPYPVFSHMFPSLMMAFGTSSSTVTMPVTMKCLEERAKLNRRIVRFCIPVGTTINMNGTALYEAIAAIYIAQYRDIPLSFAQILVVSICAVCAAVGASGTPSAGISTMVIILNAVNLPVNDVALIIIVDWALDRLRTITNILGDAYGTYLTHFWSKADIEAWERIDRMNERKALLAKNKNLKSDLALKPVNSGLKSELKSPRSEMKSEMKMKKTPNQKSLMLSELPNVSQVINSQLQLSKNHENP